MDVGESCILGGSGLLVSGIDEVFIRILTASYFHKVIYDTRVGQPKLLNLRSGLSDPRLRLTCRSYQPLFHLYTNIHHRLRDARHKRTCIHYKLPYAPYVDLSAMVVHKNCRRMRTGIEVCCCTRGRCTGIIPIYEEPFRGVLQ